MTRGLGALAGLFLFVLTGALPAQAETGALAVRAARLAAAGESVSLTLELSRRAAIELFVLSDRKSVV